MSLDSINNEDFHGTHSLGLLLYDEQKVQFNKRSLIVYENMVVKEAVNYNFIA